MKFMTSIFDTVRFPLPIKHYTNSQTYSRETNACGGCMFPATSTHNHWEWRCRADKRKWVARLAKLSEGNWQKRRNCTDKKVILLWLFGNSSASLTKDRPALGAKCVGESWRRSSGMTSTSRPPLIWSLVVSLNHIRSYRTGGWWTSTKWIFCIWAVITQFHSM